MSTSDVRALLAVPDLRGLAEALRDPVPRVARAASRALARLWDPTAVPYLLAVRGEGALVLYRLGLSSQERNRGGVGVRASKVEVVVLGLLAEEPMYGYDLLERFRARSMGSWVEVGRASVYQALRRLEERGLASGRQQEGSAGPDRHVYRITAAGRARLRAGLRERTVGARPYETDAALALGFAHLVTLDESRRAVARRETALREWRRSLGAERERVERAEGPGRALALRMLDLQDALAQAEQRWLERFGDDLPTLRG